MSNAFDDLFGDVIDNYIGEGSIFGEICAVKVKKLNADAQLPTRGSEEAAGWDLYANLGLENIIIQPHATVKIGTGLAMAIEKGWEGQIRPRSGLATKKGLRPANTPGTIDSDYRGEIIVALHNDSDENQLILNGERIAQICFKKVPTVLWKVVDTLDDTDRGTGGFGSTGEK